MINNVHINLEERHCFGHNEIDVTFSRDHRKRKYDAVTEASQKRLQKLFPAFYVELNGGDGIEIWQVWRRNDY